MSTLAAMDGDKTYHHGDLRAALVDIARELVREAGPEGWSMREASRRAGVSQAAPYRHFTDKAELLDAVGCRTYQELEQRYLTAIEINRDPASAAVAVARAYLKFALDEPRLFRLIFSSPKLHESSEARRSYAVFERAIRDTQAAGGLPAGAPDVLAQVIWSGVHGLADLILSGSLGRRRGLQIAERLLDALLRGLRASSPTGSASPPP